MGPKVTAQGISALAKLENLQEFLYCNHLRETHVLIKTTERRSEFFSLCLRLLPWLKISGWRFKFERYEFNFPTCYLFREAFRKLNGRLPSLLGLRQLVLRKRAMPVGVALPNLETLYVLQPKKNFQLRTELPNLRELVLQDIEQEPFEQILFEIGHQLRKLSVSVTDTLALDSVFRMCPKLEVFQVSDIICDFIGLKEPLDDSSCLTELGFVSESYCIALKTEDLLQILKVAPNLRILNLHKILFSENGSVDICKALEQRSILQNLEKFDFYYEWSSEGSNAENLQTQKNCFSVFQSMILLCPKLFEVKEMIYWN